MAGGSRARASARLPCRSSARRPEAEGWVSGARAPSWALPSRRMVTGRMGAFCPSRALQYSMPRMLLGDSSRAASAGETRPASARWRAAAKRTAPGSSRRRLIPEGRRPAARRPPAPARRRPRTRCRTARWSTTPRGRQHLDAAGGEAAPPRTPPRAAAAPAPDPRRSPRRPGPARACAAGRSPPAARSSRSSHRPWPCPAPAGPGPPPAGAGVRCGGDCTLRLYRRLARISPLPSDKKVTVWCQSCQSSVNFSHSGMFVFDSTTVSAQRPDAPADDRNGAGTSPGYRNSAVKKPPVRGKLRL